MVSDACLDFKKENLMSADCEEGKVEEYVGKLLAETGTMFMFLNKFADKYSQKRKK